MQELLSSLLNISKSKRGVISVFTLIAIISVAAYAVTNFNGINVAGNIAVSGTVDGVDISTSLDQSVSTTASPTWVSPTVTNLNTNGFTDYLQIATPATPSLSHNRLYFKSDDNLYMKNNAGTETVVNGGSSGANTALSNLTSPTSVNQTLKPSITGTFNLGDTGGGGAIWLSFFGTNFQTGDGTSQSQGIFKASTFPSGASGPAINPTLDSGAGVVGLMTPNNTSGIPNATKNLRLETGNVTASAGDSGDIYLRPGTVTSGTRGDITFVDGTEGTTGHVWTSTGTGGEGGWAAASGGGANTFLSNLVSPTAINQDLIFNKTNPTIRTPDQAAANSDNLHMLTGAALTTFTSGTIDFISGTTVDGNSGQINSATGSGAGNGESGLISLITGNTAGTGNTGAISASTGNAGGSGAQSGSLDFFTGSSVDNTGGGFSAHTGDTTDANSGNAQLYTGSPSTTGDSGNVTIYSGENLGSGFSGVVDLHSGNSTSESGLLQFYSGDASGSDPSGNVNINTGSNTGTGASGDLDFGSGSAAAASSGLVTIGSGNSASTGNSGIITLLSGTAAVNTGNVNLSTGASSGGNSGDIKLTTGTATGIRGGVYFVDGSQGTSGECWVSSGTGGKGTWDPCGNVKIAIRYKTAAGQSIPNAASSSTIVNYDTSEYNTCGACVTTGAGWVFTAPRTDKYHISATIIFDAGPSWNAGDAIELWVQFNGTDTHAVTAYQTSTHSTYVQISISDTIALSATDTISVGASQSSGAAATLLGSSPLNWINIESVGGQ